MSGDRHSVCAQDASKVTAAVPCPTAHPPQTIDMGYLASNSFRRHILRIYATRNLQNPINLRPRYIWGGVGSERQKSLFSIKHARPPQNWGGSTGSVDELIPS